MLETSGLVRTEKSGRVRTCTIVPNALGTAMQWIDERKTTWEKRFDRLDAFLEDDKGTKS